MSLLLGAYTDDVQKWITNSNMAHRFLHCIQNHITITEMCNTYKTVNSRQKLHLSLDCGIKHYYNGKPKKRC